MTYGLVKTAKVPDAGVPFIIEPRISIITPPLPNLNINPTTVSPDTGFKLPDVPTSSFDEIRVSILRPNLFEPPALNDLSTGFAQGQEIGLNTNQNYIISNSTVNLIEDVELKIVDRGYTGTGQYSWDGKSDNRSRTNRPANGGVWGTTSSTHNYLYPTGNTNEFSQSTTSPGLGFLDDLITRTDRLFPRNTNWRTGAGLVYHDPTSQQVFMNVLTNSFDLIGNGKTLKFENHTTDPYTNASTGIFRTNTIRVISVNHAYGSIDKTTEFNLNADLSISGRDGYKDGMLTANPKGPAGSPHMTVGIEHQAYGSLGARAINNNTMTLEKVSAKTGGFATNITGMTAMVEDYGDYGHHLTPVNTSANSGIPTLWYLGATSTDGVGQGHARWAERRQAPWESTMENRGKIVINSINSIGIDFAEYTFIADLKNYQSDNISGSIRNPGNSLPAYNDIGSLNIYTRVGNIVLNNEDPDVSVDPVYSGTQGSYGLRVPNIFKTSPNSQIYYDETVIDGTAASIDDGIVINGSHNVGISISKLITGSERVRAYHKGNEVAGLTSTPADGHKPYLDARPYTDPIGNIYNLNIKVDGRENVGLLRKSDYMEGINYDQLTNTNTVLNGKIDGLARAKNDFIITDSHIERIDFANTAKGGILFRTDKFGIDMAKNNFVVTPSLTKNQDASGNDIFNIVMLSNGTFHSVTSGAPASDNLALGDIVKVSNSKDITIGTAPNSGYNMIGIMAYNGGEAHHNAAITVNSKDSIGVAVEGEGTRSGQPSKDSVGIGTNSNVKMTGDNSVGIYNNGRKYTMNGGTVAVEGDRSTGVYASGVGTALGTTIINSGTVTASGNGSVALYATDGADITLNGTTLNVGNNALLFYGGNSLGTDHSQINLTGNATANIASGGTAFYIKGVTGDPIERVLTSTSPSNGTLTLNMNGGSTLIIAEGNGGNATIGARVSTLSSLTSGTTPGMTVNGVSGSYTPFKATRLHLLVDRDSNFDNMSDAYLNSEFSSSSITLDSGITISGSGAITAPASLVSKSKVAIAQKNTSLGLPRNDVVLTNNGTINFTGTEMTGIAGENSVIINNGTINVTGNQSSGIVSANGSIVTNNGTVTVGDKGVGIAGINYFGSTETTPVPIPVYGDKSIEIVNNGVIRSEGSGTASVGILAIDIASNSAGIINAANPTNITLGNSSIIDMSKSPATGLGVYSKGLLRNGNMARVNDNGANIIVGSEGIGFYLEGTELFATGGTISGGMGVTGKGIYTDSNVINNKDIVLTGNKSIGIHNYGVNSQYGVGNLVQITNTGNITMGDSTNSNDPSIGIYTKTGNIDHQGNITVGSKSLGIYSETIGNVLSSGNISVGDEGTGILKKSGILNITGRITGGNSSTAVYGDNGVSIINNSSNISVGDNFFGFVILDTGVNNYTGASTSQFEMGSGSVYLYKRGTNGVVNSSTIVKSTGISSAGFYADNGGVINNTGTIDFSNSVGSIGAYSQNGGRVNNLSGGVISVGASDITNNLYSIGMATKNGGTVYNDFGGTINVTGNYGIGMFAEGPGSRAENYGTINLVSAGELKGAYGMYIDNQATGVNHGTIISGAYGNDSSKGALFGVAVMNGGTLENHGVIDIDAGGSYGVYIKDGIIKNYGTIRIGGMNSIGIRNKNGTDEFGNPITDTDLAAAGVITSGNANSYLNVPNTPTQPALAGSTVISPTGVVTIDGKVVPIHDMTPGPDPLTGNFAFSNVGIYIDTLGRTKPIDWVDGFVPSDDNDLIIGAEAAELSTSKAIKIGRHIMSPYILPYMSMGGGTGKALNAISGSLTWTAQPIIGSSGLPEEVIMAKIPYTDFVAETDNAWNFADGLEQRYGVEEVGTREKELFNKLNSIGKNEQVLLTQAYDEMMGHQYANVQQRIHSTGKLIDKEIEHLGKEWETKSKQSNKIKAFGMRDEYSTDTAGIIDYKSDVYGFAYLHEDETLKLGNSSGWYAGAVYNRINFKDIGKSKENTTMLKLGVFKSTAFDHNGSLKWTISGEGYVARSDMHRKFLVVDDIFNAKSSYTSYGIAVKNEIGKEFRTSERTSIRPYGALKLEYGRFGSIKENTGEVRLEVEGNKYYSIRPEVGIEFKYKQPMAVRTTFITTLGLGYENELGKIGDVGNRARVRYTEADWFNIRGEKDDRRGNFKADLNVGIENQRFGVTFNAGYDTKGENIRGGIGFRAIY